MGRARLGACPDDEPIAGKQRPGAVNSRRPERAPEFLLVRDRNQAGRPTASYGSDGEPGSRAIPTNRTRQRGIGPRASRHAPGQVRYQGHVRYEPASSAGLKGAGSFVPCPVATDPAGFNTRGSADFCLRQSSVSPGSDACERRRFFVPSLACCRICACARPIILLVAPTPKRGVRRRGRGPVLRCS